MAVSVLDDTANAHYVHRESIPGARINDAARSFGIMLQDQVMVLELQQRYRAVEKALQEKGKECQDGSERLAKLHNLIQYENDPLLNQGFILDLKRRCQAEEDALLTKEEERQVMHKHLASLQAVIELYESSSPTTSI